MGSGRLACLDNPTQSQHRGSQDYLLLLLAAVARAQVASMQIYAGPPVFRRRRKPYVQAVLQRYTESGKYQALPTQRVEHPWALCLLLAGMPWASFSSRETP
ncbi:unnamed protein product [Symbiodinium microadriaticum]|nr:unnamed protein product [Symbiodinium microadriaticum]